MDIVKIGRSPDNDVVYPDKEVSRYHCELYCLNGKVFIKDLDSTNGTKVNGTRVTNPVWLKKGDSVVLGSIVDIDWFKIWTKFYTYSIIVEDLYEKTVRNDNEKTRRVDNSTQSSHVQSSKEKAFVDIPSSMHIKKEYAEVYKKGDDFQVPFKRKMGSNIGHHVGNTLGCIISVLIIAAVIAIIVALATSK